jgi:tRNA(Ile)-lysidine synthase
MALLHALLAVRDRLRMQLEVVHFDHGLRPESPGEADWVTVRVRAAGLPLHVRRATHLRPLTHGVQAAARAWRRAELLKLQTALRADWIATGHQRDDHLETLLLKLLRGVHLSRLRGMDWRSPPFIRPLLGMPRQALQAYLESQGRHWLEDPSNASGKYRRNRVRNELLPLLDELAGGAIAARLGTLERQSRQLAAWLASFPAPKQSAPDSVPAWLDVASLRKLPPLARAYALEQFVQHGAPGDLSAEDMERALALLEAGRAPRRDRWTLQLPAGRRLDRRGARLLLSAREPVRAMAVHRLDDVRLTAPASWQVSGGRDPRPQPAGIVLANLPAGARLEARLRNPGDRFHPAWRNHPVKVKDFLRDQHVPLWERDRLALVVLDGVVIAIYPHFVAREFVGPTRGSTSTAPVPFVLQVDVVGLDR